VIRTSDDVIPPLDETGSVLRREALEHGLTPEDIRQLVRTGVWVRIRRGAYARRSSWGSLSPERRHLVTARAVLRSLDEPCILGHVSAAVALGLPTWGADLRTVHVIRPSARHGSRLEAGVAHHSATLPEEHITEVDGMLVTTAARTVLDHARSSSFEAGVVTADAALHRGLTSPRELLELLLWQQEWPGSRIASRVVAFADRDAESPGESRGRVRISQARLPRPQLQVEIWDPSGILLGRADFLFDGHHTIGEFDGRIKYGIAGSGPQAAEVLWQEKLREDALRALGYEVVRFTWDDLERSPAWLRSKFLAAFARAKGRVPTGLAIPRGGRGRV
jgi:hypothetical protein